MPVMQWRESRVQVVERCMTDLSIGCHVNRRFRSSCSGGNTIDVVGDIGSGLSGWGLYCAGHDRRPWRWSHQPCFLPLHIMDPVVAET